MKLSKKGMYYRAITRSGAGIFGLAIVFPPALLLLPLILAAGGAYEYLYWKNFEFYFEGDDLKIRSGVITKNELDIPVRRIQDIDTQKNIVERVLGITKINVKTAGGDTSKASLKYLESQQAEKVREELRDLKNRRKSSEEETSKASTQEQSVETFYDIDDALMTFSILSGVQGLAIVAVIFLTLGIGLSAYVAATAVQMIGYSLAAVILTGIASILMLVSSTFSTYSRYYDFTIEKRGDTFEYERGLFNKQGGSIPEEKIQKLEITENFLMRYLGYASLKAETAGYTSQEDATTTSTKVLIPLDTKEEVYRRAQKLGDMKIDEVQHLSDRARKRYTDRYALVSALLIAVTAPLIYIGFHPGLLLIPVAALLAVKKAASLKWMNIGYSLGDQNLLVMKGFWNRRTYIIPYFRFQNLMVTESIFQRRWNLGSLTVDTAGDKVINPRIVDLDRETAFELRNQLYQKFKASIY